MKAGRLTRVQDTFLTTASHFFSPLCELVATGYLKSPAGLSMLALSPAAPPKWLSMQDTPWRRSSTMWTTITGATTAILPWWNCEPRLISQVGLDGPPTEELRYNTQKCCHTGKIHASFRKCKNTAMPNFGNLTFTWQVETETQVNSTVMCRKNSACKPSPVEISFNNNLITWHVTFLHQVLFWSHDVRMRTVMKYDELNTLLCFWASGFITLQENNIMPQWDMCTLTSRKG